MCADKEEDECVICLDHRRTHVLAPCGHFSLCPKCATATSVCPICRRPVELRVRVFRV